MRKTHRLDFLKSYYGLHRISSSEKVSNLGAVDTFSTPRTDSRSMIKYRVANLGMKFGSFLQFFCMVFTIFSFTLGIWGIFQEPRGGISISISKFQIPPPSSAVYNRWDRWYPRRTPMETPGTDWATSAVIVPRASPCSVHKNLAGAQNVPEKCT